MAKRILMVVLPDDRADYMSLARSAAESARASGGSVRVAYIAPVPTPRMDRNDYIVADSEQEIERITAAAHAQLARFSWEFDDVPVELVVRFGRLAPEVAIEAEMFGADLVALAAPHRPSLRRRLLAWYLARVALASRIPLVMTPPLSAREPDRTLSLAALRSHP